MTTTAGTIRLTTTQAIHPLNIGPTRATGRLPQLGDMPAEVTHNRRKLDIGTDDTQVGFACVGHKIVGAWGVCFAEVRQKPTLDTLIFCGDGAMMPNSDIFTSVPGHKRRSVR